MTACAVYPLTALFHTNEDRFSAQDALKYEVVLYGEVCVAVIRGDQRGNYADANLGGNEMHTACLSVGAPASKCGE